MARLLAAGFFAVALCLAPSVSGQPAESSTSTTPTLKDTLEKGLKARLPSEFAYIADVVAKVDNGTLPRSVVQSTFLWARKQPRHPFEYFQQGLKVRAEKLGVTLEGVTVQGAGG